MTQHDNNYIELSLLFAEHTFSAKAQKLIYRK